MRLRFGLMLLVCGIAAGCAKAPPREVNLLLPRMGSQTLFLHVGEGQVDVTPSSDGTVHVGVKLERPRGLFGYWTSAIEAKALDGAALSHSLADGVRNVQLSFPAGTDGAGIQQIWQVQMPPIMYLKLAVDTGEVNVGGVAGGMDVNINVGNLGINVPYGALHAKVGVGAIEARAHVLDYGAVLLATDIGTVELTVNEAAAGTVQRTGAGARVDYQGKGTNVIDLSSGTGKVSLALSDH